MPSQIEIRQERDQAANLCSFMAHSFEWLSSSSKMMDEKFSYGHLGQWPVSVAWIACSVRLPFPFLGLVDSSRASRCNGSCWQKSGLRWSGHFLFLDRHAHVATISSLATVAFIFADTLISRKSRIPTTSTRTLSIAALLALATALAARFG